MLMKKKLSKYKAIKTEVDGIVFHSKKEASRYQVLKLLQRSGMIEDLTLQPKFNVVINDQKICSYSADFQYKEKGLIVVEDVKGMKTPVYNLKKKLMFAVYRIKILET